MSNVTPPSKGVPDTTCCGGESEGNEALYAAGRHPLASFAERDKGGRGVSQPLRGVVGLDGLTLDEHGCVATLEVLAAGRHRAGDVART